MIETSFLEPYLGEPDKKRLKAAIRREAVDRVPNFDNLIEDLHVEKILGRYAGNTWAYKGEPTKGIAEEESSPMHSDDFIDLCNKIGQDAIYFDAGSWTPFKREEEKGLMSVSDKSVKNRKDFKKIILDSDNQLKKAVKFSRNYKEALEKRNSKIGVMAIYGCLLQTLYEFLTGIDDFMLLLYDDQFLIEEMLEASAQHFINLTNVLIRENIDFIFIADDIAFKSGLFISPKVMKKIWIPKMASIIEPAVNAGIPVLFHSDGKIDEIMEDLIEMGVECINPMDPTGIDYRDYKKRYGSRIALCGNINVEFPLTNGSPEDVEKDVKEHMKILKPGYGYISDSSHSIMNCIPFENYMAYLNSVHKYGIY